ncbi:MAG: hypothetical protein ACE5K9_12425 [Candidatus Methylomirabilales bacterium]
MVTLAETAALILAGVAVLAFAYAIWKDSRTRGRLDLLANAVSAPREIVAQQQEHLGLKKERFQWDQVAGVAKALGWAYDRGLFDEGEEEP